MKVWEAFVDVGFRPMAQSMKKLEKTLDKTVEKAFAHPMRTGGKVFRAVNEMFSKASEKMFHITGAASGIAGFFDEIVKHAEKTRDMVNSAIESTDSTEDMGAVVGLNYQQSQLGEALATKLTIDKKDFFDAMAKFQDFSRSGQLEGMGVQLRGNNPMSQFLDAIDQLGKQGDKGRLSLMQILGVRYMPRISDLLQASHGGLMGLVSSGRSLYDENHISDSMKNHGQELLSARAEEQYKFQKKTEKMALGGWKDKNGKMHYYANTETYASTYEDEFQRNLIALKGINTKLNALKNIGKIMEKVEKAEDWLTKNGDQFVSKMINLADFFMGPDPAKAAKFQAKEKKEKADADKRLHQGKSTLSDFYTQYNIGGGLQ